MGLDSIKHLNRNSNTMILHIKYNGMFITGFFSLYFTHGNHVCYPRQPCMLRQQDHHCGHDHDHMVVGFITIYAISAYHH